MGAPARPFNDPGGMFSFRSDNFFLLSFRFFPPLLQALLISLNFIPILVVLHVAFSSLFYFIVVTALLILVLVSIILILILIPLD